MALAGTAVCWPEGACIALAPDCAAAGGLSLSAPIPCKENEVAFWSLGGPSKGRLRVVEDPDKLLQLAASFTIGLVFRPGAGNEPGHDSLLLGHDNKHWLALRGNDRTLCGVDGTTGQSFPMEYKASAAAWSTVFLQPRGGGTVVYAFDDDGLFEVGVMGFSLAGSRLRNMGWASNEVQVAKVAVWQTCVGWGELAASLPRELPPPVPALDPFAKPKRAFRGQVVDTSGKGLGEVAVGWPTGGCVTDEDGCFAAEISDVETDIPDGASADSAGSTDSWLSMSFTRKGFAPAAVPAQGKPGQQASMQVTLLPISASATITPERGGSVTDAASGSSVTVPPNGLTYPDGSPVTGPVTVSLSVLDATDPASLASMPGDFSAIAEDGAAVFLQSLGAAWVGATDEAGRELVVDPSSEGVAVDLKSNATANLEKLGTWPDMWTFNNDSGKWESAQVQLEVDGEPVPNPFRPPPPAAQELAEAGTGLRRKKAVGKKGPKKGYQPEGKLRQVASSMSAENFRKTVASAGQKSLSAKVKKMGYINCDIAYAHPVTAVMLTGRILAAGDRPVRSAQLWSVGRDYQGRCSDITDDEGKFGALIAQFDSEVDVEVHLQQEVSDDAKLEVYYDSRDWLYKIGFEVRKQIEAALGPHKRMPGEVNGLPAWEYTPPRAEGGVQGPRSHVAWSSVRHRWEHTAGDQLLFVRYDAADLPALPFGPGWQAARPLLGRLAEPGLPAPSYSRAMFVEKHLLGPFKTGSPGEFVDAGTLVIN